MREPTTNCPSAPILNTPVLNEKATLSPVNISGAAYIRHQIINLGLPKIPFNSCLYASRGFIFATESRIAPTINPNIIDKRV